MRGTRAAVRYAKALIELALEQGVLEKVCEDMKLIHTVCTNNHAFAVLLKSPIIKTDKKQSILSEVFKGKISKLSELFIQLLTAKKRESYLDTIDEELRKKVLEIIKGGGQSEVELIEKTNDKLIGGFTLQVGDNRVDASIAKQIRKLSIEFSENPY